MNDTRIQFSLTGEVNHLFTELLIKLSSESGRIISPSKFAKQVMTEWVESKSREAHERTATDGTGINADLNAMVADWE